MISRKEQKMKELEVEVDDDGKDPGERRRGRSWQGASDDNMIIDYCPQIILPKQPFSTSNYTLAIILLPSIQNTCHTGAFHL